MKASTISQRDALIIVEWIAEKHPMCPACELAPSIELWGHATDCPYKLLIAYAKNY